jgi:hypothetical protein
MAPDGEVEWSPRSAHPTDSMARLTLTVAFTSHVSETGNIGNVALIKTDRQQRIFLVLICLGVFIGIAVSKPAGVDWVDWVKRILVYSYEERFKGVSATTAKSPIGTN